MTYPSDKASTDVTMETLRTELETIKRTLASVQETGDISQRMGNLSLDESNNPLHRRPKTTAALYHGMEDDPLQEDESDGDFPDGQ